MGTQTEVKIEKVPWVLIVLLTFFFGFFGPVYALLTPNASWYALGRVGCKLLLMIMPMLFIMCAAVLGKLLGKPIGSTTYTYLYAAGTGLVAVTSTDSHPLGNFINILYDRTYLAEEIYPWAPFMAPSADVVKPMIYGGAAVPWGEWIPTIMWWSLLYAGLAIFALAQGAIWRKRWIDVEKVPFPHTRVAIELINKVTSSERSFRARFGFPTILGILIGVAYQLPLLLAYMFPWFPDIYGWRTNTCTMGAQWITPDSPLAGIVGLAQFNKNPAFGAIFYMAPLNILFGAWFWYLIFVILMQVAFMMGYYTGIVDLSGCGRVWCGSVSYRVGAPFKWNAFSSAGVSTGIFIAYIALNWKYLAETFNAAIGRLGKDKLDEFERNEPTSYRNAYILLVLGAVLIIAMFMAADVTFPAALLLVITNVVVTFVASRAYSLVGFVVPAGSNFYEGPMKMLLNAGANPNREWYVAMGMTYSLACEPITGGGTSVPFVSSLASFQIASVNGVSNKNVFMIQIFVCILAPFIAIAGTVWGFYAFGIQRTVYGNQAFYSWYNGYTPDAVANRPTYEPWLPHMLAGMIFAGILSFLHARFVWFPLEPIGFLLATDGHALIEGIWTMTLAAWIMKTITLRVGGSKLYEQKGIPVAIGFVIGVVIVSILGGSFLVLRFFFPF